MFLLFRSGFDENSKPLVQSIFIFFIDIKITSLEDTGCGLHCVFKCKLYATATCVW